MDAVGMKTLAFFLCFAFVHSRGCAQSKTATAPKSVGETYVGFVVDETNSMHNELENLKGWIAGCADGQSAYCGYSPTGGWLITALPDPDVRRVVGPTTDITKIIEEVDMYWSPKSESPQEWAFTGLRNLVNVIPADNSGCKIFFITDAQPSDSDQLKEVTNLYKEKGCNFIPILTYCGEYCPPVCNYVEPLYYNNHVTDHTPADDNCTAENDGSKPPTVQTQFYTLAEETGGNIFSFPKNWTGVGLYKFLKEEATLGFCGTTVMAGPEPLGYRCLEDCEAMEMCWDKSVSKCYCQSDSSCRHDPVPQGESLCVQEVECDCEVEWEITQDYFDCTGYYQCNSGTLYHLYCAPGTIFSDESSSYCDFSYNVPPPCGTMEEEEAVI